MVTYISEVLRIIEKWSENNMGTSPTKNDVLNAISDGVDEALQFDFIRQGTDGGYVLNKHHVE